MEVYRLQSNKLIFSPVYNGIVLNNISKYWIHVSDSQTGVEIKFKRFIQPNSLIFDESIIGKSIKIEVRPDTIYDNDTITSQDKFVLGLNELKQVFDYTLKNKFDPVTSNSFVGRTAINENRYRLLPCFYSMFNYNDLSVSFLSNSSDDLIKEIFNVSYFLKAGEVLNIAKTERSVLLIVTNFDGGKILLKNNITVERNAFKDIGDGLFMNSYVLPLGPLSLMFVEVKNE